MRRRIVIIVAAGLALAAGCATPKRAAVAISKSPATAPSTRPTENADLSLDEVALRFVKPGPATATTAAADDIGHAPLDAVELFARGRDAMLQGQRQTAINFLERAVKLDPKSYELRFWLGQAYTAGGLANQDSIAAYEAAAAIDPDHVVVHS